jgi:S-formylglutathione hydrolase FrmB
MRFASSFLLLSLTALAPAQQTFRETENVKLFELRSELLSAFWGREIKMQAGVVIPSDHKPDEKLPVCYSIHGFGGSHLGAQRNGPRLVEQMRNGYPRMLYVFLNAACPLGHHEFADSVNNGPWGKALTEELVPALERSFHAGGSAGARFLTGHSSGGWSSLWLQVVYPDFFGGTWSTAPDSVDFRDFTGIDVYRMKNAYEDPDGKPIQLVRRNGQFVTSIQQFVEAEVSRKQYGGQFASFDAVFSPRGEDGRPMPLFDRKTGAIDPFVARSWERYDIGLILKRGWETLGPKLAGKLKVFVGTLDTFRLEGALRLLQADLKQLGSDAEIVFAEGRDHGSVMAAHELWPDGLLARIHKEMRARFDAVK